jgi:V/A-type H+-transporting ATPase subunit A
VDAAVNTERQRHAFRLLTQIIQAQLELPDKAAARSFFYQLRQRFLDWNGAAWDSDSFQSNEQDIRSSLGERQRQA